MHAVGPTFLATPWNVYVTVLPYGALVFLTWAVVAGERWALPAATFATSFLMQTHVGYVALALPLLARRRRVDAGRGDRRPSPAARRAECRGARRRGRRRTRRGRGGARRRRPGARRARRAADPAGRATTGGLVGPVVVSVAIAVVMWLPPVVQQVTHEKGNIDRIVEWFREGDEEARTLLEGWRVVADQYTLASGVDRGPGPARAQQRAGRRLPGGRPDPARAGAGGCAATCGGAGGVRPGPWPRTWFAASVVGGGRHVAHGRAALRLPAALGVGPRDGRGRPRRLGGLDAGDGRAPVARSSGVDRGGPGRARRADGGDDHRGDGRGDRPRRRPAGWSPGWCPRRRRPSPRCPATVRCSCGWRRSGRSGRGSGWSTSSSVAGVDVVIDDVGAGEHRSHREGDPLRATLYVGVDSDVVRATRVPELEMIAFVGVDMASLRGARRRRRRALLQASTDEAPSPTTTCADGRRGPSRPTRPRRCSSVTAPPRLTVIRRRWRCRRRPG